MLKRNIYISAALLLLSGCTVLNPRVLPDSLDVSGSEDELLRKLDDIRMSNPCEMFKFMEGYQPVSLVELKRMGRLKIGRLPAAVFIPLGLPAYTNIMPGTYGDIYSAEVHYSGWLPISRKLLVHELSHAQGCVDRGPFASKGDYTAAQKAAMAKDGVSSWADTTYYKNEDPTYHAR